MAIKHISDFTATAGTDLTAITPPVGTAWALHPNGTTEVMLTQGTRIYRSAIGGINVFYIPDVADGDDFDLAFNFHVASQDSNWMHILLDVSTAANTFYSLKWEYDTDNQWRVMRRSAGTDTHLSGSPGNAYPSTYSNGTVVAGRVTRRTESGETKIRLYLDGSLVGTWTDASPLTATRRAGHLTDSGMTSTTGLQLSGMAVMNPSEASFTVSPDEVDADSTGNVITLTGTNTPWDAIRAGFGVSAGTITNVAYNANNDVDITYDAPGSNQTITITCFATGATQTFDVINGENPAVTPGSLTRTAITDVGGSFTWTAASGGTGSITAQLKRSPAGAGTYTNVTGATSSPATDTTASPGTSYDYKVVYTDSLSETADSDVETFKTAHSEGFADLLVSDEYRAALSGLTLSILRPTKASGNPIWPNGGQVGTWDRDIYYPYVIRLGVNDYRMVSSAGNGEEAPDFLGCLCYYTSQDGRTWTRPNLGLFTYDGSTNNNIVVPDFTSAEELDPYDGTPEGRTYVMAIVATPGMSEGGIVIICSEDLIHWTKAKEVYVYPGTPTPATEFQESKGGRVYQRSDDTWITFYSQGHFTVPDIRHIGAYVSDTSDLEAGWTDIGHIITGTATTDQRYDIEVIYQSVETWLAVVGKFNQTSDVLTPMRLYVSHDEGETWTLLDADWIPGGTSDWESGQFGPGYHGWREGNAFVYAYTGTTHTHGHAGPLDEKIGIASMGWGRFGEIEPDTPATERSFVTDAHMTGSTTYAVINCNGTGGTVKVEVLSAQDDSVITGYAKTDATAITRDVYGQLAQWGSTLTLPANQSIKLKFYLTDATLYSYEVTNTRPKPKRPFKPMMAGI